MIVNYRYHSLLIWVKGGVAFVKINKLETLNALTGDVRADMTDFLSRAERDDRIKVIVITGEGRVFSIGGNPKDGASLRELIHDTDKPVIAAVNGFAIGAGMELAMGCDMVIAATDAKFFEISSYKDIAPSQRSLYYLNPLPDTGDTKEHRFAVKGVGAEEAARMGIVNKLAPEGDLLDEALKQATAIVKGFTVSIKYAKRLMEKNNREGKDLGALRESSLSV